MLKANYKKLWKILETNNMKKTDLYYNVGISTNAIAKMGKNEDVRLNILVKLCDYFKCSLDDIVSLEGCEENAKE